MSRPAITDDKKSRAKQLLGQGMSQRAVARALRIAETTVRRIAAETKASEGSNGAVNGAVGMPLKAFNTRARKNTNGAVNGALLPVKKNFYKPQVELGVGQAFRQVLNEALLSEQAVVKLSYAKGVLSCEITRGYLTERKAPRPSKEKENLKLLVADFIDRNYAERRYTATLTLEFFREGFHSRITKQMI